MRAEVGGAVCILALLGPAAGAAAQESEIRIDGRIVEEAWEGAVVVSDFVQGEPVEGAAAERPTVVCILFGDDAIYVRARLTEAGGEIARQLVRRDEAGPQTWGVNFVRWRVSAGERTFWALESRNRHGRVSVFRASILPGTAATCWVCIRTTSSSSR